MKDKKAMVFLERYIRETVWNILNVEITLDRELWKRSVRTIFID